MNQDYQQGNLVELDIIDLSHSGDGVGKLDGKAIFVPDTVTGDRIVSRLTHVKKQYAYGKLQEIISPSPHRIRPNCIVADKCGGCQWQHISAEYQLTAKENQVIQALKRLGGFENPPVLPILSSPEILGYRNKATYPLRRSTTGNVQAGYYQRNTHQLINLNQCPIQDPRLNPILAQVKQDIQAQGWSIYNETTGTGKLRHLGLRIGKRTGEILLTLVSTSKNLTHFQQQAESWLQRYPDLVGVSVNYNPHQGNKIFGEETFNSVGRLYLTETFGELNFQLSSDTFFQVNTEAAEILLKVLLDKLCLTGKENLVDAYCGVGTFTLPLAKKVAQAVGIESNKNAIEQGKNNADMNGINNVKFYQGTVEKILPFLNLDPDIIVLDPPRKGCDRNVIHTLKEISPPIIIYISCQPSTLARDLEKLCQQDLYTLEWIQPIDFFPQTPHVESVALIRHNLD
ncbi:putative 23S rRNA methyltransferase/RumA [Crocosphaera subtropica ATCC 51142]|uniref:23S rRNA methyltransferase/RumA n=1 Tax=Crocosphaera subtropica (strain ATCC 51142 / BH68) TaxID=43989 RepID=B1WWG4_CROS5|nr:23S rRNA (uracil(1939)-C(5))-methyltransferase RlmD [Crocosphaera subtropica]ACB50688.1 putative 23S rRNA methyltransferase/RumA [Crocosphaera subtropica ATCC 51142]